MYVSSDCYDTVNAWNNAVVARTPKIEACRWTSFQLLYVDTFLESFLLTAFMNYNFVTKFDQKPTTGASVDCYS